MTLIHIPKPAGYKPMIPDQDPNEMARQIERYEAQRREGMTSYDVEAEIRAKIADWTIRNWFGISCHSLDYREMGIGHAMIQKFLEVRKPQSVQSGTFDPMTHIDGEFWCRERQRYIKRDEDPEFYDRMAESMEGMPLFRR